MHRCRVCTRIRNFPTARPAKRNDSRAGFPFMKGPISMLKSSESSKPAGTNLSFNRKRTDQQEETEQTKTEELASMVQRSEQSPARCMLRSGESQLFLF